MRALNWAATLSIVDPDARAGQLPYDDRLERYVGMTYVFLPFAGLLAAVYRYWRHGIGPMEATLFLAGFVLSVAGVEVGFHRCFSHVSFKPSRPVKIALAFFGSVAAQGPLLFWTALHRRHHRFSDVPGDPHSPHLHGPGLHGFFLGLWHAHAGWIFDPFPTQEEIRRYVPDLIEDPVLRALSDFNNYYVLIAAGLVIPAAIGALWTRTAAGALQGFLWGGLVRVFFAQHTNFSVNSLGHTFGARPYRSDDESRNNALVALVSLGAGWHNNHHAFPYTASNQFHWWQLDPCGWIIQALEKVGQVSAVKFPERGVIEAKENAG